MIRSLDPVKDVDGFHPINAGFLLLGRPTLTPATPAGILELLREYKIGLQGADAVVIGRSNIVGKPISLLLLAEHATVTITHSRTQISPSACGPPTSSSRRWDGRRWSRPRW